MAMGISVVLANSASRPLPIPQSQDQNTPSNNQTNDDKMDHSKMAGDHMKGHDNMSHDSNMSRDDKMDHQNETEHPEGTQYSGTGACGSPEPSVRDTRYFSYLLGGVRNERSGLCLKI